MQATQLEKPNQEIANSVKCKYCRDEIPSDALICRTCNEPQSDWRRATKFLSGFLSSVVAAGSLGIAYLQYVQAEAAQKQTVVAKASEAAQVTASQNAVRQILNGLPVPQRTSLMENLSRQMGTGSDVASLQNQILKEPTNADYRAKLLLRQFVPLNEKQ